ncbi:unnamed protein product [Eruca vesicaria subsp. sativa]|uniref:Uncharacterized protein n=1 Tax=Eruca vesicaria subsp. sativa TaxID=29727 RepID=A0ABC8KJE9_ERUVS|nr:unnamed protein product [Eruca vesicaria subsp. sativa]
MKLAHVLLSQVKHLEAWQDMGRQHFSSISISIQAMHSLLSRVPLREGTKVNIESAVTIFQKGEAVSDAIILTVNSFAPKIKDIVPLASQLAEVVAQEKLVLEQCHDLMRMISELEMEERSLK